MDDRDELDDQLDDDALGAVLRRHAEQLTGAIDTEGALEDVQRRARTRRRWRARARRWRPPRPPCSSSAPAP